MLANQLEEGRIAVHSAMINIAQPKDVRFRSNPRAERALHLRPRSSDCPAEPSPPVRGFIIHHVGNYTVPAPSWLSCIPDQEAKPRRLGLDLGTWLNDANDPRESFSWEGGNADALHVEFPGSGTFLVPFRPPHLLRPVA